MSSSLIDYHCSHLSKVTASFEEPFCVGRNALLHISVLFTVELPLLLFSLDVIPAQLGDSN